MAQQTRPYAGYGALVKRGGSVSGGLTTGDQRDLFVTNATPLRAFNNVYPPGINSSSFPSVVVIGKRTPSFIFQTCMKPFNASSGAGWADAALFKSLINVDTTLNTDLFCLGIKDERSADSTYGSGLRKWDWARCEMLQFQSDAVGGPVMVTMGFRSRWGENDADSLYGATNGVTGETYPAAPSFTGATVDPGQLSSVVDIDFRSGTSPEGTASTLKDVQRWVLTLMRGQAYEFEYDRTRNPKDISSKMFSGILEIHQNPNTDTYITGSGTVNIRLNTDKTSTTGCFAIALLVNADNLVMEHNVQSGLLVSTFSLIDLSSGGNPATFTAFTPT